MGTHTFTGGAKLEAYLAELALKVKDTAILEVGFMEGATYPDGTSVPLVAALNEYGVPSHNQPPRPYFRTMIDKESPHWGSDLGKLLKQFDYSGKVALTLMGHEIKAELQESINQLVSPPLSPVTIARKGFEKPLIDTNQMMNSVDFRVKA